MKSLRIALFIFLFSSLCSNHSYCQTGWYQVSSGTNKYLNSVFFVNLNTGFSVGADGTLLVTNNTGASWQSISLIDTTYSLRKIYFKDQSTGFILGQSALAFPVPPDTLHSRVYKTTDGGMHWFVDQPRILDVFLTNIEFVNSSTGYMSGGLYSAGPNKVFKTTNSGNTWVELKTGVWGAILSQKFTDVNTGYLGIMNSVYKTTNGGETWNSMYANLQGEFYIVKDISFINGNTGFAAGGYFPDTTSKNRFVIKTTNAGATWNYLLNDNTHTMINSLTVVNEGLIYAGGTANPVPYNINNGFILRSTNGGITWTNESIPTSFPLSDIKSSNTKGFAVGFNGVIYKKDNIVSVTQISTEVPSSINLYQNYPNPFNPETTIKFDISKAGFISLKVYDMAGKEVQNLFNGVKEAGSYQLKFDGAELNSGVYFYKLMTNGTTITKSMVLVK